MKNLRLAAIARIALLTIAGLGCTAMAKKPTPPAFPGVSELELPSLSPPPGSGPSYKTRRDTPNPVRKNDVTVEIVSIGDVSPSKESLELACDAPGDLEIKFSAFPRAAVIRFINHSEHILSLGRTALLTGTVIVLEDERGTSFRLFSAESWRLDLEKRIKDFYDDAFEPAIDAYTSSEASRLQQYLAEFDGKYAKDYEQYTRQHEMYAMLSVVNPLWWTGILLTILWNPADLASDLPFSPRIDHSLSPSSRKNYALQHQRELVGEQRRKAHDLLRRLRDGCLQRARDLEAVESIPMMLSGEYPPIRILPHRDKLVYVPFEPAAEYPKLLRLQIFDLMTKGDAAGVATHRSNFSFVLEQTP